MSGNLSSVPQSPFALAAVAVAVAALVLSALDRRRERRWAVAAFVVDGFRWSPRLAVPCALALAGGLFAGAAPAVFFTAAGWVSWSELAPWSGPVALLAGLTVAAKLVLAATEELVFRGALIEQLLRRTSLGSAVMLAAGLYAVAHLGRGGDDGLVASLVHLLDGIGFGVVTLATGSLWVSTCWHGAKDVTLWLLDSDRTLQLTDGLLRATPARTAPWIGGASAASLVDLAASVALVTAATYLVVRQARRAVRSTGA